MSVHKAQDYIEYKIRDYVISELPKIGTDLQPYFWVEFNRHEEWHFLMIDYRCQRTGEQFRVAIPRELEATKYNQYPNYPYSYDCAYGVGSMIMDASLSSYGDGISLSSFSHHPPAKQKTEFERQNVDKQKKKDGNLKTLYWNRVNKNKEKLWI